METNNGKISIYFFLHIVFVFLEFVLYVCTEPFLIKSSF